MWECAPLPENAMWITDCDDPRIADYRAIQDRDRIGADGRPGLFMGEQFLIVEKMLAIVGMTKSVLVGPHAVQRIAPLCRDDVPLFVAPLDVLRAIAGFNIHRGVLAVGYRPDDRSVESIVPRTGPCTLLLCEGINNMDNIGMLFRNAAAFGADGVILSPKCHDPLYRKALRVSIGHVLSTPWARSQSWYDDLDELQLTHDIRLLGAAVSDDAKSIEAVGKPERIGILVGQEFMGLSSRSQQRCDTLVRIPMVSGVDSLNVATAAGILLHHFSHANRL